VYLLSGSALLILLVLGLLYYWRPGLAPTPTASTLPVITITEPAIESGQELAVAEGQKLRFAIAAASSQVGPLQYVWLLNGQEQARGPTWTYQPQFDEGGLQPKVVTVRVTDQGHHTAERSWQVGVREVNRPPIITAVSPPVETLEVWPPVGVSPSSVLLSEGEVQTWLEAHRHAWEEKNVDLLTELGVVTPYRADRVRQILSTYKSFKVALQNVEIRITGSRAAVNFSRIDTIDGKAVSHPDRKHFTLEKEPSGRLTAQPQ
jgi:hypothetical protein